MVREITLRQVGGSIGATIPKDMAERLHLEVGDRVLAVETDRGILLSPYDPDVEAGLKVAARTAKKFRNALRELAQ
jgi:putative addiction module antidote